MWTIVVQWIWQIIGVLAVEQGIWTQKCFFLRELKEEGLIITNWIKGGDNPVDLFTKNLSRGPYEKCIKTFVGEDQYFREEDDVSSRGEC